MTNMLKNMERQQIICMSNIKYGLISELDGRTLEKTIDLICDEFPEIWEFINVTEIGLFNCETLLGMNEYINKVKERNVSCIGIDNEKDKPIEYKKHLWFNYIKGNSNEVYNQLQDNSQHMILIDANHSYPYVLSDFFCYERKLKTNGFMLFHDSAPQAQGKDWQRIGSKDDKDMYISVEKVLIQLGFIHPEFRFNSKVIAWRNGWKVIFDEYDPNDEAGGFFVIKKLY